MTTIVEAQKHYDMMCEEDVYGPELPDNNDMTEEQIEGVVDAFMKVSEEDPATTDFLNKYGF